jgi:hypothetical protein
MAKLSKISNKKPIALSVEGVFVRNLPAKVIDEKFGNIQEKLEKDQEGVILSLFTDLICDEDGNNFEDCDTFDKITEALSILDIQTILGAIPKALMPNAAESGK